MPYNPSDGTIIPQSVAKTYGTNYKEGPRYPLNNGVVAQFLGSDKLNDLLKQEGCVGLRIYYGSTTLTTGPSQPQLVVVGVDSQGNDILSNELILDGAKPCPNYCAEQGHSVMD